VEHLIERDLQDRRGDFFAGIFDRPVCREVRRDRSEFELDGGLEGLLEPVEIVLGRRHRH
jgi:hypothetical protein